MDSLAIVIRCLWSFMFILGTFSSGLVIFFTIFRVRRHQRNNIYFVRVLAIFEFASGIFGWCSMPRTIPTQESLTFVSYGICTLVGPNFCYICTVSMLQCLVLAGSIVPLTFAIRYVSLRWSPPNYRLLVLATFLLLTINCFAALSMISIYSPPESWYSMLEMGKVDKETFARYELYGPSDMFSWQCELFLTLLIPMGLVSSSISFTFRFLIMRFLKNASKLSPSTLAMQRKFVKMLTIQAALPIVGIIPAVTFSLLKYGVSSSPILQAITLLFDSSFHFLSGFITLFYLSDYRRLILRQFFSKYRNQQTTMNSTGLNVSNV